MQILLTLLFFLCPLSGADVLLPDSRLWQRADTVTPGQRKWSFQIGHQDLTTRMDSKASPLGRPFARALTWGQLMKANPKNREEIQSYMTRRNLNEADYLAYQQYEVDRRETTLRLEWAYGFSRNWMFGFQLPVVHRQTVATSRITIEPKALAATEDGPAVLSSSPGDLRSVLNKTVQQELGQAGFEQVPQKSDSWDLGDLTLFNQVAILNRVDWTWSIQQVTRLPMARNPSLSNYLRTNTDDGQIDLGLSSMVDYRIARMVFGFRLGGVTQLPDRLSMRSDADQIERNMKRNLGDWIWASVDSDYRISDSLSVNVEQSFLSKEGDRYEGDTTKYLNLGKDTSQQLHQSRFSFFYRVNARSVIPQREKQLTASIGYAHPWLLNAPLGLSGRAYVELISSF
jgi:hypothetical protein